MKPKFYHHITDSGYIYDKRIFWAVLLLGVMILGFLGYTQGLKYTFYFECPGPLDCDNPMLTAKYYNPVTGYNYFADCEADWCTLEKLPPGTYGEKATPIIKFFAPGLILLLIFGLALNHLMYNDGKMFSIKLNLPTKWLKYLKDKANRDEEEGEE